MHKTLDEWASALFTAMAKDVKQGHGKNSNKKLLVHKAEYQCIVPMCDHKAQSLTAYLVHLAQLH